MYNIALLLAMALVAQDPWDPDPVRPPLVPVPGTAAAIRADLVMQAAVEDFAAQQPHAAPPEPYRSMISHLGGDCFHCRERASKRLLAASKSDLRWLFWGRKDPDLEIRLRCNNILRKLTTCSDCKGRGLCFEYRPILNQTGSEGACRICGRWQWGHPESPGPCLSCTGEGVAWNKGAFD